MILRNLFVTFLAFVAWGFKQMLVKYHERNIHVPSLSVRHG